MERTFGSTTKSLPLNVWWWNGRALIINNLFPTQSLVDTCCGLGFDPNADHTPIEVFRKNFSVSYE